MIRDAVSDNMGSLNRLERRCASLSLLHVLHLPLKHTMHSSAERLCNVLSKPIYLCYLAPLLHCECTVGVVGLVLWICHCLLLWGMPQIHPLFLFSLYVFTWICSLSPSLLINRYFCGVLLSKKALIESD